MIYNLLGYAVVDVNMRGTGCSGGAFDFFEPAQALDGYDVIETVATPALGAQRQAGDGRHLLRRDLQLFVAATRPPNLAAITPLSLIDNTQTTLYPGGILNTGFALELGQGARPRPDARRVPTRVRRWAYDRIQAGDSICNKNQELHPEAVNLLAKVKRNSHYKPKVADPLAPVTFVHKINVPTFVACQWTDEQTGGHCPTLSDAMTGTDKKWFTFTNGTHIDSLDPETFNRFYDFLQLYVAKRKPDVNPVSVGGAPAVYELAIRRPRRDHAARPDPDAARLRVGEGRCSNRRSTVRILFDNGAGGPTAGNPVPGFEQSFDSFPVPGTSARSFYLGDGGELTAAKPSTSSEDSFNWDAGARPFANFTGNTGAGTDGLWTATPPYDWAQNPAGTAASYVTPPLDANTAILGAGALEAWVKSSIARPRPSGDDHRGPPRRQGNLRAERLDAYAEPQARPQEEHRARAGPEPAQEHDKPMPKAKLREADGPPLLPGPRLPGRVADPRDDQRARRRPADLGLRRDEGRRLRDLDRALARDAVAAAAARRSEASTSRPSCRRVRACAASRAATTFRTRTSAAR